MALATALANVGRYYVRLTVSSRMSAWGALIVTVAMIYGPKVGAYTARKRTENSPSVPVERFGDNGANENV